MAKKFTFCKFFGKVLFLNTCIQNLAKSAKTTKNVSRKNQDKCKKTATLYTDSKFVEMG
jgi:hypothetical protein